MAAVALTRSEHGEAPATKRLSLTQRCDIAAQAIAAIITSALMAAPFVVSPAKETPRVDAVIVAAGPSVPVLAAPQLPPPSVPAPRRLRQAVLRSTFVAQAAPVPVGVTGRIEATEISAKKETAAKPLGRRLAGLFVGDGSYKVRPFPTVPQQ